MASAPDDGAPTPPSAVPRALSRRGRSGPFPAPAASRVPDGTGAFVQDALRRCGMRWDRVVVHLDRAIVQANATVVPVTTHDKVLTTKDRHGVTVPRDVPAIIGTRHLVVKFVHILETTFRDDEHRERTPRPTRAKVRVYRARQRAPDPEAPDAGQWATPFTYLVEGDAQSDTFVIVMDDVSKLKPGVAERARAGEKNAEAARRRERRSRGIGEGDDRTGATADGDGATADEDGATADAAAGTTTLRWGRRSNARRRRSSGWRRSTRTGGATFRTRPPRPAQLAAGRILDPGEARVGPGRSGDGVGELLAAFHDDETLAAHRTLAARLRGGVGGGEGGARGEIGAPSHPGGGGTVVPATLSRQHHPPPVAEVRDAAMDASGAATDVVDDRGRRRGAQPSAPDPAVIDWQWAGPARRRRTSYISSPRRSRSTRCTARTSYSPGTTRGSSRTSARGARLGRRRWRRTTSIASRAISAVDGLRQVRDGVHVGEVTRSPWRATPQNRTSACTAAACRTCTGWCVARRRVWTRWNANDRGPARTGQRAARPEKDPARKRGGPVARLVAELLGTCVFLADEAGDIVRGVAERGHLGVVRDKSDASKASGSEIAAKRAKKKSSRRRPPPSRWILRRRRTVAPND